MNQDFSVFEYFFYACNGFFAVGILKSVNLEVKKPIHESSGGDRVVGDPRLDEELFHQFMVWASFEPAVNRFIILNKNDRFCFYIFCA
jgi:hypothetical protein